MIGFKAFLNYQVYNQSLNANQSFTFDSFELSVKDSYITKVDFRGRVITDKKYYLAVIIGMHNRGLETKIRYIPNEIYRILFFAADMKICNMLI